MDLSRPTVEAPGLSKVGRMVSHTVRGIVSPCCSPVLRLPTQPDKLAMCVIPTALVAAIIPVLLTACQQRVPSCQQVFSLPELVSRWPEMHSPPGGAAASTRTRPRSAGAVGRHHGRCASARRAGGGGAVRRSSHRELICSPRVACCRSPTSPCWCGPWWHLGPASA